MLGRKALALALLLGFHALTLAVAVAASLAALCLCAHGALGLYLGIACAGPALVVMRGLWLVRPPDLDAPREPIDPAEAPELYVLVEELAAAIPTPPPTEIFLTADRTVAIAEMQGERVLFVGASLLATSSVAELRSLVARELGHAVFGGTGIVAWAQAAFRAVLARRRLGGVLATRYARMFFALTRRSDRRAALAADLLAAQLVARDAAPPAATASALVDIDLDAFLDRGAPASSGVMRTRRASAPELSAAS